jgi:hypothetical protein
MHRIVAVLLLALSPTLLCAQAPAGLAPAQQPGPRPHDLALSVGLDGKTAEVGIHGFTEVPLHIKNLSSNPKTLTHVGINSPAFLLPIGNLVVAPGATQDIVVEVDGRRLHLPSPGQVVLQLKDSGATALRSFQVVFVSKELFSIAPEFLFWKQNESPASKVVKVTNVPMGAKLLDVRSNNSRFTARLAGDLVVVTPDNTETTGSAEITFICQPEGLMRTAIQALILGSPGAPATSESVQKTPQ